MLAIRFQRTGKTGHAQFRVIIQDSRFNPKSGRVTAYVGSYNPHTKVAQLDTETIGTYLDKGAQPSDRVARLLKKEGVKLPAWVKISPDKKREPRKSKAQEPVVETDAGPTEEAAKPPAEETAAEAPPKTEDQPEAADIADALPKAAEPAAETQPEAVPEEPEKPAK
jgi:small subunit ribosomal protein S16